MDGISPPTKSVGTSNNLSALRAQICSFFPRFIAVGKWAGKVSAANGGMRQSRMLD
jgi:hypothetical protein